MALWAHYWANGPMPPEALDAYLCEKYHCPPDVLDRQDPLRVLKHLTVWEIEQKAQALRNKPAQRPKSLAGDGPALS